MAPTELNFITGNKNKLAEVQAILASSKVKLSNKSLDLLEIQGTIEEISRHKCITAAEEVSRDGHELSPLALLTLLKVKGPVLVEDTCLCFNAFDELPGPYVYGS